MDTSNATTLADLTALTTENYRRDLAELTANRQPRRLRGAAKPPRVYRGRQVLAPTTRKTARPNTRLKAARHPWADRLHAARTGGVVVERGENGTFVRCYGCGGGFGAIGVNDEPNYDEIDRWNAEYQLHETGACVTGVTR